MPTIFQEKEQSATETPILLFDCVLSNGDIERWSTHKVVVSGATYHPRVLLHNLFQMQTSSDMGVDAIPKISVTLANADSHFSELERSVGWKGASVTVTFLFFKLKDGIPETETMILFKGIANPPDEIKEATFRLTAVNRMSMQRVLLPPVRVERRCPWEFPANLDQRTEAVTGGAEGRIGVFPMRLLSRCAARRRQPERNGSFHVMQSHPSRLRSARHVPAGYLGEYYQAVRRYRVRSGFYPGTQLR